ncbi:MAG: AcrR family transcriptional regulator [Kiritimatiellia bacterium]|jgi:AcrR family transcriptional regulator|tara:strand:- start:16084 stop:16701 length:618 start_codon:yes stop_codon:yes gene_type:complete
MKALPTQARAKQKRCILIIAATECFTSNGYENTTAKTIASAANVATGTFYQYFDNKEDMLRVIAQQRMEDLYQQVPSAKELFALSEKAHKDSLKAGTTQEIFHHVLKLIYAFHEQAPELHQVLEQRKELDPELAEILEQGEILLHERVLQFVQSFNIKTADAVAFNLFAMAEGLVHRHVFGNPTQSKATTLQLGAVMLASYFDNL